MARGGRISSGGFASGTFPKMPMNLVLVKGLFITAGGSPFHPFKETPGEPAAAANYRALIRDKRKLMLTEWATDPTMKPHISHRYKLSEIKQALYTMEERQQVGRVIVHGQEF